MSQEEKIEKIESVDSKKNDLSSSFDENFDRLPPNKEKFDGLIRVENTKPRQPTPVTHASLMEEIRDVGGRVDLVKRKTPSEIVSSTKDLIAQIDSIKTKLNTPNLNIDQVSEKTMQNKLEHIDEKLQSALSKVGIEYQPTAFPEKTQGAGPLDRFFGLLTTSQHQLETLGGEIGRLHEMRGNINPADILAIQIKVGFISTQMELFTGMLNKCLESTKTIMNVQV